MQKQFCLHSEKWYTLGASSFLLEYIFQKGICAYKTKQEIKKNVLFVKMAENVHISGVSCTLKMEIFK